MLNFTMAICKTGKKKEETVKENWTTAPVDKANGLFSLATTSGIEMVVLSLVTLEGNVRAQQEFEL